MQGQFHKVRDLIEHVITEEADAVTSDKQSSFEEQGAEESDESKFVCAGSLPIDDLEPRQLHHELLRSGVVGRILLLVLIHLLALVEVGTHIPAASGADPLLEYVRIDLTQCRATLGRVPAAADRTPSAIQKRLIDLFL